MLVELLQPLGPELVRRWVATLLMVPRDQREAVVASVEARIAELYEQSWKSGEAAANSALAPREIEIVHPPQQRDGYIEQVVTTYEDANESPADHASVQPAASTKPARKPAKNKKRA
ncbi:MAG TPA: hypothetical protein VK157_15675 [Phycisphaerales bacterium]|nr:hypothetical protein [Phycisphaerales bacterium]